MKFPEKPHKIEQAKREWQTTFCVVLQFEIIKPTALNSSILIEDFKALAI